MSESAIQGQERAAADGLRLPTSIRLVDVGLRDGLQVVDRMLPMEEKLALVHMLIEAGVTEIELTSFAHPRVLPQFSDAVELLKAVPRTDEVRYRVLVPNLRGAERASEGAPDVMVALTSADEQISQINQNASRESVLAGLPAIGAVAVDSGAQFVVGIANAFFAWGRGAVSDSDRHQCVKAAVSAGAQGIYLACTTGMEDPLQVYSGVKQVLDEHPRLQVGVHLHARNGMALANALAACQAGAVWLEGSFGGLGGDLWAPGDPKILGNVPFEDLVAFSDALGMVSGVNLEKYLGVVERVADLTGWAPTSAVVHGGLRSELAAFQFEEDTSTLWQAK